MIKAIIIDRGNYHIILTKNQKSLRILDAINGLKCTIYFVILFFKTKGGFFAKSTP